MRGAESFGGSDRCVLLSEDVGKQDFGQDT